MTMEAERAIGIESKAVLALGLVLFGLEECHVTDPFE